MPFVNGHWFCARILHFSSNVSCFNYIQSGFMHVVSVIEKLSLCVSYRIGQGRRFNLQTNDISTLMLWDIGIQTLE